MRKDHRIVKQHLSLCDDHEVQVVVVKDDQDITSHRYQDSLRSHQQNFPTRELHLQRIT